MSLKEIAKRDLEGAIIRFQQAPTVQNWLAMDRLAEAYVLECEEEARKKQEVRNA